VVEVEDVVEVEERPLTIDEIRAKIDAARRKKEEARLQPRDTKQRRKIETKQRKGRVNPALLRGEGPGHDQRWTVLFKAEHIKAVKDLAKERSEPGAKVSYAMLIDEAIELLLAKYRNGAEQDGAGDAN
jgi:hypothetical protein